MPSKGKAPQSAGGGANENDSASVNNQDEKRSARSAGDGRSTARDGKTESNSQYTATSLGSETRLSEMANLDLQFKSKFVQFWLHTKISIRLMLILTVPMAALIILLVIVLSNEVKNGEDAKDIVTLATLADGCVQVLREMSSEHTDSLWWLLDKSLSSGISATKGGIFGDGYYGKKASSDVQIEYLKGLVAEGGIRHISPRLADLLANIMEEFLGISDLRYNVERWRVTAADVDVFFEDLVRELLNALDLISVLADAGTIQLAQSLSTWVRGKTAQERERHIIGQVILLKRFSVLHYGQWLDERESEELWKSRFQAISPTKYRKQAMEYFSGEQERALEELRFICANSYIPGNESHYPLINFRTWMDTSTTVNNFYRDTRKAVTAEIIKTATDRQNASTTSLSLFILLAILAAVFSVTIALAVGWSIDSPWRSMLRMKDRMFEKLHQEEQRNVIVNQFVPSDFFTMMGIKTLFEVQLGQCMLKRATVVCNEIRNFSKLSERMAPQQNFQFLSMWLQDNGPVIRRHGGFIEKFRGTGLTAIFADPNDALDAGLELLEAVRVRNGEASNASVQIESGIAIHTGDLMLGTVGDQMRMETAIISEALATALQITKVTTLYEANLLLSRDTYMLLNVEGISARFLGESGARDSKVRPQVYEVLQPTDESKLSTLTEFNQAVKVHQEGEFENAVALYDSILEQDPSDVAARRKKALAVKHELVDFI